MNQKTATGTVGTTKNLSVTVQPTDADNKETVLQAVTWATSDAEVATVENGTVTFVKAGAATITATSNDLTATCQVTVTA